MKNLKWKFKFFSDSTQKRSIFSFFWHYDKSSRTLNYSIQEIFHSEKIKNYLHFEIFSGFMKIHHSKKLEKPFFWKVFFPCSLPRKWNRGDRTPIFSFMCNYFAKKQSVYVTSRKNRAKLVRFTLTERFSRRHHTNFFPIFRNCLYFAMYLKK